MVSTRSERYDTNTILVRIVFVLKNYCIFIVCTLFFDNCYSFTFRLSSIMPYFNGNIEDNL